jgi:hypothetical protein
MQIEELSREYQIKTDDELLRLALDPQQLTPEANFALTNELAKRRIHSTERLSVFREEEERRKMEVNRNPGALFFIPHFGVGRKRLGKADYSYRSETGMEQFKTTVFVVLFWLLLIPTGTYRVERKRGFLSNEMTFMEKLPLDWMQVFRVWIVAAVILIALIWGLSLLVHL